MGLLWPVGLGDGIFVTAQMVVLFWGLLKSNCELRLVRGPVAR